MRKYIKDKLIQILISSEKLDEMIINAFAKKEVEAFISMLTKNQDIAIKVGQTIENIVGADNKVVAMLEAYCEMVFLISQSKNDIQLKGSILKLQQKRNDIILSIEEEIPTRYEIVFLSYTASMWDSLESIWKAASDDEMCDAYVVALPYYDKDENGNFGKCHYDVNDYPKYVPIVDYRQYDIESRNPDIIYFHNPYDEYNASVSVPPKYYACELRKYTDKLVYVPYFVGQNGVVQRHFCALPGSMYSNKVIVESEVVRKIYIEELQKFEIEKNCKGLMGDIEDKFVAIGSPKFDKAIMDSSEDMEIPDEWKKIIYTSDGRKKKLVMYNTSISCMLSNANFVDKIRDTLRIMMGDEEIVVLWRPHPMYETTIRNFKPEILKDYLGVVKWFKTSGRGIFDETADFNRAVIMSDAYYGDGSSVAEIFRRAGKPVMIQDYMVKNALVDNSEYTSIPARVVVGVEDETYMASESYNGIFKVGKNNIVEYIGIFEDEKMFGSSLYCDAVLYDNKIFYVPFCAKEIAVLNLEDMSVEKIPFMEGQDDNSWKFTTSYIYKDKLFMIPGKYEYIVSLDMKTYRVNKIINLKKYLENDIHVNKDTLLAYRSVGEYKEKVYVVVKDTKILLEIDLEKKIVTNKILLPEGEYLLGKVNNKKLWIIPKNNGRILKLDLVEMKIEEVFENPISTGSYDMPASKEIVFWDNEMYLFPQGSRYVGVIDLCTGECKVHSAIMDELFQIYNEYPEFVHMQMLHKDKVFSTLYYRHNGKFLNIVIDIRNMSFDIEEYIIGEKWKEVYLKASVKDNGSIYDNESLLVKVIGSDCISMFLEQIKKDNNIIKNNYDNIGKRIHDYIRRLD